MNPFNISRGTDETIPLNDGFNKVESSNEIIQVIETYFAGYRSKKWGRLKTLQLENY